MGKEKGFLGVLLNDQLPKDLDWRKVASSVVNLQNAATPAERKRLEKQGKVPGSHWVAFFNDPKSRSVEYFDSYGLPPTNEMLSFLRSSKKNVVMNDTQYQKLGSTACGWFAMYYIKKRNRGYDPYRILYHFDQQPDDHNEQIIQDKDEEEGEGLISNAVNLLVSKSPFELHPPGGWQFLGAGTHFVEREARGERGINRLDNGAYWHDKAYNENPPGLQRALADKVLYQKALAIANDPNTGFKEKFYAKYVVPLAMKTMFKGNYEEGIKNGECSGPIPSIDS